METRRERLVAQMEKVNNRMENDPGNTQLQARAKELTRSIKNLDEHGEERGPRPNPRPGSKSVNVNLGDKNGRNS